VNPIFFAVSGFAICGPKLPQICKLFIFFLTNTYLKCSIFTSYKIKNKAKQTLGRFFDSFAIKGGNLRKDVHSFCLMMENWRIIDLPTGTPKKFADLRFVDQSKEICRFEICGLAYLRNLQIL
jgi:hypothetical protein